MTLTQLKYVITIADTGSMNEAAKLLFISQPSLSLALKELEKGGYLVRKRVRGADGRMSDTEYNFYEEPVQQMEEQPEEDVMNDSDVAGLAMGWMLKGD